MAEAIRVTCAVLGGALLGWWIVDPSWTEALLAVAVAWVLVDQAGWGPR